MSSGVGGDEVKDDYQVCHGKFQGNYVNRFGDRCINGNEVGSCVVEGGDFVGGSGGGC